MTAEAPPRCTTCGSQLSPGLLSCPGCRRLLYADTLRQLADRAQLCAQAGDRAGERAAWQEVRALLPAGTAQAQTVDRRIAALVDPTPAPAAPAVAVPAAASGGKGRWLGALSGAGGLALLGWKFKGLLLVLLSQGKLLLLGLTKVSTLSSMLLFLGVYWAAWGWPFALGLVLSLYIHEMGHVAALRRYGIAASAPLFIPGLGALVRLRQRVLDPGQDARIGLAGPQWGTLAALACFGAAAVAPWPLLAAVGRSGAWLNLFNLLPLWQLDGGRAFAPLSRPQRALLSAGLMGLWLLSREGLLLILCLGAGWQALRKGGSGDRGALLHYAILLLVLTALLHLPVATPTGAPLRAGLVGT